MGNPLLCPVRDAPDVGVVRHLSEEGLRKSCVGGNAARFPKPGSVVRVVWSSSGASPAGVPQGPWPCGASLRKIVPLCLPACGRGRAQGVGSRYEGGSSVGRERDAFFFSKTLTRTFTHSQTGTF